MDRGRLTDLMRLQQTIDNPLKSRRAKREADKTRQIIIKQMRDPKIAHYRQAIIRALQAQDYAAEHRIVNQLRHYLKQEQIEA